MTVSWLVVPRLRGLGSPDRLKAELRTGTAENMKMILSALVSVSAILFFTSGCKPEPSGFPLSIATVQKIDSGSIEFEERQGKIVVFVTDEFGDSHIHILNHDGMSKADALAILAEKQEQLQDKKPEQPN